MASTTSAGARMPKRARTLRLVRGRLNCWSELEAEERNPGRRDGGMDGWIDGDLQRDHACDLLWTLPHVISGVLGVEVGHWGRVCGGGVKVPRSEPPPSSLPAGPRTAQEDFCFHCL